MIITVAIVITVVLGLIVGSVINVYTYRSPAVEGAPVTAHHGGRAWAIALPLSTAAIFSLITWRFLSGVWVTDWGLSLPRYYAAPLIVIPLFYAAVLILISVNDIKYQVVTPQVVNIALAAALGASFIWFYFWPSVPVWPSLGFSSAVFGMAIGGIAILLPYVITGGRGVGFGDVMVGAFIGAALGFPLVIIAIVIGWAGGICAALTMLVRRKKSSIPFGPSLAVGALITLLWGPQIYHCLF